MLDNDALVTPTTTLLAADTVDHYKKNTDNSAIDSYPLTIMTERNQPLAATVYHPQTSTASKIKTAVMIAPATGIKRQFYHSFATFLAEQGFGVITYDNEGIGQSLSTTLALSLIHISEPTRPY